MRGQEFADLRAFATIADQGNFSRAAAKLQVTPSALSQTIRDLEARLGVRLLNRTTRSMSLTDAGARLLAGFKPAMEQITAAVHDVSELRATPTGTVRLNLPRLAAASLVEPVLGAFHEAYPDVILELAIDDAIVDLAEGGYDVGITLGELLKKDMIAVKVGRDIHQLAVAAPDYIARHGRPETPSDLHAHRCINWRRPSSGRLYDWEFFVDGRWLAVAVEGPLIVSHRDVALQAAAQGVGVAFAYWSERWLQPLIAEGRLVPLLEQFSPPFPGWFLYYPSQRYMPAAVRVLIDFLRRTAGGEAIETVASP
jgi:DNA-binding transcriptional LysR family regulator